MSFLLRFNTVPEPGLVVTDRGQEYELIMTRPHRRKDGTPTVVLTWRSRCATCGEPFTVTTGLSLKDLNRRCPRHHRPGLSVNRSRKAYRRGGAHG